MAQSTRSRGQLCRSQPVPHSPRNAAPMPSSSRGDARAPGNEALDSTQTYITALGGGPKEGCRSQQGAGYGLCGPGRYLFTFQRHDPLTREGGRSPAETEAKTSSANSLTSSLPISEVSGLPLTCWKVATSTWRSKLEIRRVAKALTTSSTHPEQRNKFRSPGLSPVSECAVVVSAVPSCPLTSLRTAPSSPRPRGRECGSGS